MRRLFLAAPLVLLASSVYARGADDPVVSVALLLSVILVAAKVFGHAAEVLGQPAILGELVAGMDRGGGAGRSKKEAEQESAEAAWLSLQPLLPPDPVVPAAPAGPESTGPVEEEPED